MEQERPDNEIPVDDQRAAEWPADEAGSVPSSLEVGRPDVHADAYGAPMPGAEDVQNVEPPSPLEVVDPYTAAPPATIFTETVAPFEQPVRDNENPWRDPLPVDDPFVPIPYIPATQNETIRRSGLAWSAGIAFFGSVAFTLFLGWLADLLLGTSPWGIVGGIVLGSVIGFLQFFRITSQIFTRKDDGPEISPLMSRKDDE